MENWGPKVQHNGGNCPVLAGTYVRVFADDGRSYEGHICKTVGHGWNWNMPPCEFTGIYILAYQVREFKALADLRAVVSAPLTCPVPA